MKIPKGTKCIECGLEIKTGDENIGHWKKENVYRCEKCTSEKVGAQTYARVVGYISPVTQWNKGKAREWEDRKEFKI